MSLTSKTRVLQKTIYFSRVEVQDESGEYIEDFPHQRLFIGHDNEKAIREPVEGNTKDSSPLVGLIDPSSNPKLTQFRVGGVREADLPLLLAEDNLSDLDGALVSMSHVVFFEDHIVGMVRQDRAPREGALTCYLQSLLDRRKEFKGWTIVVRPLVTEDFFKRIKDLNADVSAAEFKIIPSEYARLKDEQVELSEVIGVPIGEDFARRAGAETLTLTVKAGRKRTHSLNLSFLKGITTKLASLNVLKQAKFKQRSQDFEIKLARDNIKTTVKMLAVGETNRVEDVKAYAGIREAYTEIYEEIRRSPMLDNLSLMPYDDD